MTGPLSRGAPSTTRPPLRCGLSKGFRPFGKAQSSRNVQELVERRENMRGEVGENRGKRFSTCSVIHKNLNLWTGKPRSALFQKVKADVQHVVD